MASFRLFAPIFLLSSVVCVAQNSTAPVAMNSTTVARLNKEIPSLMVKADVPGLSMSVTRSGKTVWTGSFGVRSVATKMPGD